MTRWLIEMWYAEGVQAFYDGLESHECPHHDNQEAADMWEDGWHDANDGLIGDIGD